MNKKIEKESLRLFVLMMICNVINYFFQIIMGRILNDVSAYGTMNALLSILNIVSLPVSVVAMIVTKYVAEYNINNNKNEMKTFLLWITKRVVLLVAIVCLVGLILSNSISQYIHINNGLLVGLIIFGAAISYLIQIIMGYFQGTKNFLSYGVYNLVAPVLKLIICISVFFWQNRILGITASIAGSNCIAILIGAGWLIFLFKDIKDHPMEISGKSILEFSSAAIFLNIGITLLNNVDMILIKHYFVLESGYYGVASVLGKLILYVSSTIVVVLFPYTIEQNGKGENTKNTLKKALLYSGIISIIATIGLSVCSKMLIRIMYGMNYLDATKFIFPIGVLVTALSILTIIANYQLALEQTWFITGTMLVAVLVNIIIIVLWHEKIMTVIWVLAIIALITSLVNLISVLKASE